MKHIPLMMTVSESVLDVLSSTNGSATMAVACALNSAIFLRDISEVEAISLRVCVYVELNVLYNQKITWVVKLAI